MKRILYFILMLVMLFSLSSCSDTKKFTHCEITLTLARDFELKPEDEPFLIEDASGIPVAFSVSNEDGIDMALCDGSIAVTLVRISHEAAIKEGIFPGLTQLEFAKFYMNLSNIVSEVQLHEGVPYCTYKKLGGDGSSFTFLLSFFQTPNAYFVLSFITTDDNFDNMKPTLLDYVSAVSFN